MKGMRISMMMCVGLGYPTNGGGEASACLGV